MANKQPNRAPQKRNSASNSKNSSRGTSHKKKKQENIVAKLYTDPKILLILGSIILIGIILISMLSKKGKNESQVAEVPSSKEITSTLLLSSETSSPLISAESTALDPSNVEKKDTSTIVSENLVSSQSTVEVAQQSSKKSSSSSENTPFEIAPGQELSFKGASLQQMISTEKERVEEEATILNALYETDEIPVIITANVDGNQQDVSLQTRIQAAKEYNSDTVGWIRIKGTALNFAVVQSTKSNIFYQDIGYDKKYSHHIWGSGVRKYGDYGVIWASYDSVLTSREELSDNTVIFGHNWENISANPRMSDPGDIMMEHIAGYAHTEYAQENPYINFSIDGEDMTWVVVSAFYTEDLWANHSKTLNFDYIDANLTDDQKALFISEIEKRSEFTTDDVLTIDDNFLTLSTCTRAKGSRDDQRFVVVARLVREDEELPVLTYQDNPNIKAPVFN